MVLLGVISLLFSVVLADYSFLPLYLQSSQAALFLLLLVVVEKVLPGWAEKVDGYWMSVMMAMIGYVNQVW